ncbi:hypothetical protein HYPSUDRAFT_202341 [Hypholoma sublateritium FD-334 SS-4]|uniref:Microbial-type PARG catalytic domain-containing protein n=1 Tax=Hypholoma sublateritium (strain FD-334 SS-4) TaxID=945553 RepID=A0A0D2MEN6_HYPSF|nr:hypothetical protein HYPSUDRAFT_202341 [Hypholoma sublateritium FD-334 SS-4]
MNPDALNSTTATLEASAAPPPYSPTGLSMTSPSNTPGVRWELSPEGYTPYVPEKFTLPPTTDSPSTRWDGGAAFPDTSARQPATHVFHNSVASPSMHTGDSRIVAPPPRHNLPPIPGSAHSRSSSDAHTSAPINPAPLPRAGRRKVANETVSAISLGGYVWSGGKVELTDSVQAMLGGLRVYGADAHIPPPMKVHTTRGQTIMEVVDLTALDAVRRVSANAGQAPRIGLLISASPHGPPGSFREGDAGQEASVLRASTLSLALAAPPAHGFYDAVAGPYHTHALVHVPGVTVFRDEAGGWTAPLTVDVVACAAVHARDARAIGAAAAEPRINCTTAARLFRVLAAFARHGARTLVLPAFGAGASGNDPAAVARVYAGLLRVRGAPFEGVFERVVFAVPGAHGRVFGPAFWE